MVRCTASGLRPAVSASRRRLLSPSSPRLCCSGSHSRNCSLRPLRLRSSPPSSLSTCCSRPGTCDRPRAFTGCADLLHHVLALEAVPSADPEAQRPVTGPPSSPVYARCRRSAPPRRRAPGCSRHARVTRCASPASCPTGWNSTGAAPPTPRSSTPDTTPPPCPASPCERRQHCRRRVHRHPRGQHRYLGVGKQHHPPGQRSLGGQPG